VIIWGIRRYVQQLAMIVARCSAQGHTAAHRLVRKRTKFTLFFVPLFPISTSHVLVCTMCGNTAPVPKERVPEIEAEAQRQAVEQAGQQFAPFEAPQPETLN
jgi:Fe2+ or Zn2+ uptake regulation protein